jgi:hypothetical protein
MKRAANKTGSFERLEGAKSTSFLLYNAFIAKGSPLYLLIIIQYFIHWSLCSDYDGRDPIYSKRLIAYAAGNES